MNSDKTNELVRDVIAVNIFTEKAPSKHAETMRRIVTELTTRHHILFKSIANKFQNEHVYINKTLITIFNELFADNAYNWGRIVTIIKFERHIAQYYSKDDVAIFITDYINKHMDDGINNNGGWDTLGNYFATSKWDL